MVHRLTTCLLLACYSAIALGGQGLHWVLGDETCCTPLEAPAGTSLARANLADDSKPTCQHGHFCSHSHGRSVASKRNSSATQRTVVAGAESSGVSERSAVRSHRGGSPHDCDHCTICQHQSLGQLAASDGVELCGLLGRDDFRPTYCVPLAVAAPHSLSQPRAPPVA